jgi:hypothetical protein
LCAHDYRTHEFGDFVLIERQSTDPASHPLCTTSRTIACGR